MQTALESLGLYNISSVAQSVMEPRGYDVGTDAVGVYRRLMTC